MTALSNVQSAETDLIAKTEALLAFATANAALIAQLQAQIAALGNVDPALQAVADALTAESTKVAAFLTPTP